MLVAAAQIRIRAGEPEKNFQTMLSALNSARNKGASLVVFPEMALPGYFIGDTWEQTTFLKECEKLGESFVQQTKGIAAIFGNVGLDWTKRNEDGRVRKYNAAFVAYDGKLLANEKTSHPFWIKSLLPNYREFDDSRYFYDLRKLALERNTTVRELLCPVTLNLQDECVRIGLSICEDGWPDDYGFSPLVDLAAGQPLDFVVNISASPYGRGKHDKRERNFKKVASETRNDILYVNAVGVQNVSKTVYGFDGSSAVYSASQDTQQFAFFKDALGFIEWTGTHLKPATPQTTTSLTSESETQQALEAMLRLLCEEWQIKRCVIGASGGIDSALSAVLFSRVLGAQNTFLINMPSRFNSSLTKNAASNLASALGCPFASMPIETSIQNTWYELGALQRVPEFAQMNLNDFVFENIQARDRGGRLLAAVAASLGAVFSCNANKSEMTVGYSTLYGDAAGFLSPIGDLWKHQVYALARHYNATVFNSDVVPRETLDVVPSAELSSEQDVTQNKGDPLVYDYHDYLFRAWVEHWNRKTPFDILNAYDSGSIAKLIGCDDGIVEKLFSTRNEFIKDLERWWTQYRGMGAVKRAQLPPVLAVSPRAFGLDHREHLGPVHFGSEYEEQKAKH